MADLPKPTALASMLKRAKLPVLYLVFGFVPITGKKSPQLHNPLHSTLFHSASQSRFRFFSLLNFHHRLIFSTKYLDCSIFLYQSPRKFAGFLSINPPVFFHHLVLRFWRFFTYTQSSSLHLPTYLLELTS